MKRTVAVTGSFDDLRARDLRFLEEAARLGDVHAVLWPDAAVQAATGKPPKFPLAERQYVLEAVRYVKGVTVAPATVTPDSVPLAARPGIWAVPERDDSPARRAAAEDAGMAYRVIAAAATAGFPPPPPAPPPSGRPKAIVTGCYDWFHSGHVRFCEECAQLGELYVVVGHDANIRLLKGDGHPLFPQDERRYVVGSFRHVHQALVSTGDGWMDAAPEIARLRPDIYVVNEDGDKPEKRAFCAAHGLRYVVLQRTPAPGLPRRTSTDLRGF